jgi:hypothetical protein
MGETKKNTETIQIVVGLLVLLLFLTFLGVVLFNAVFS